MPLMPALTILFLDGLAAQSINADCNVMRLVDYTNDEVFENVLGVEAEPSRLLQEPIDLLIDYYCHHS